MRGGGRRAGRAPRAGTVRTRGLRWRISCRFPLALKEGSGKCFVNAFGFAGWRMNGGKNLAMKLQIQHVEKLWVIQNVYILQGDAIHSIFIS